MKALPSTPANLLAKGAFLLATMVLMLGCDPGGGLPGAPTALRSGTFAVQQQQQPIGACVQSAILSAADGLPAPEVEATGVWVLDEALSDEFNGTAVDETKWSFQTGDGTDYGLPRGWGNEEKQWYKRENAVVENGMLKIQGKRELTAGPDGTNYRFTSARMRTKGKLFFKYGKVEALITVPAGRGFWPAFWMLSEDSPYGDRWASTGEIDIFETFNPGIAELEATYNVLKSTIWHGMVFPDMLARGADYPGDPTVSHLYTLEWEANELRFYVDNVHFQTIGADHYRSYYWDGDQTGYVRAPPGAPYDVDFHLLLNMAIGGNGPAGNEPDDDTVFPADMLVDYVRVYKCEIDGEISETGGGCATNVDPAIAKAPAADIFVSSTSLFTETVNDFVFCSGNDALTREMRVVENIGNQDSSVTVSEVAALVDESEHGTVLDIATTSASSGLDQASGIAFVPDDDGILTLVGMGEAFGRTANAELKMDLFIDSAETEVRANGTSWLIFKMLSESEGEFEESVFKDGVQPYRIGTQQRLVQPFPPIFEPYPEDTDWAIQGIPVDRWISLSLPLNKFIAPSTLSAFPTCGVDPEDLTAITVASNLDAHIQIDNVELVCGSPSNLGCSIEPPRIETAFGDQLNVFIDEVDPFWNNGIRAWDSSLGSDYFAGDSNNHVNWRLLETGEAGHDTVIEIDFTKPGVTGAWFIQSALRRDLSEFESGQITFDMKLVEGSVSPGFTVKIDCRDPCSSGTRDLDGLVPGEWSTFTFTAADLQSTGLDITKVNTGIVIVRESATAKIHIDNVRWVKAGGAEVPVDTPVELPEGSQPPTLAVAGDRIIFDDSLQESWTRWSEGKGVITVEEVDATDELGAQYGKVIQLTTTSEASIALRGEVAGLAFADTSLPDGSNAADGRGVDFSGFPGGTLEFDALIVSNPTCGAPWKIILTGGPGSSSANELDLKAGRGGTSARVGEWAHYSFELDGALQGLDKSDVKLMLVFATYFFGWDAVIQLDNIHIAPAPEPAP